MAIEDQGPGVTEAELERIFERFVRLPSTTHEYQGSGLGLAICKSIVELHGGSISATAGAHGKGLRVVIEIPTAPDGQTVSDEAMSPPRFMRYPKELAH